MSKEDLEAINRICDQLDILYKKYQADEDVNTGYLEDAIGNLEELLK